MTDRTRLPLKGCAALGLAAALASVLAACGGGAPDPVRTVTPPAGGAPEMTITPPGNRAPEAVGSVPDRALTEGGAAAVLDAARWFGDPDGDSLAYSAESGDPGVVTAGMSGSTLTLAPVSAGTATVTVTATDGEEEAVQEIAVTVMAPENRAPEAVGSVPAQALTEGGAATVLDVARWFGDPDGDPLTYSAGSGDPGVVTAGMSGSTLTLAPVSEGTATVTVTVTATDGEEEAVQEIAVTVMAPENRAPEAVGSVPAQALTAGGTAVSVDVARRFVDPDGDPLTYSAESGDPGVVTVRVSGSTVTLAPVSAGTATVTVTATDGEGDAVQEIAVTVRPRRSAPAVSDGPSPPPEPALTGITLGREGSRGIAVKPVPRDARLGSVGFSWDPRGSGRIAHAADVGNEQWYVFFCNPAHVGEVRFTVQATAPGGGARFSAGITKTCP